VIGFSLGAYYALGLSLEDPDRVRAVVVFHGTGSADYRRSKAAYLGHLANADDYEPVSEVSSLENALRTARRPVTFHRYAGTGHLVFRTGSVRSIQRVAAKSAWE